MSPDLSWGSQTQNLYRSVQKCSRDGWGGEGTGKEDEDWKERESRESARESLIA